jgi:hypothetical protein
MQAPAAGIMYSTSEVVMLMHPICTRTPHSAQWHPWDDPSAAKGADAQVVPEKGASHGPIPMGDLWRMRE